MNQELLSKILENLPRRITNIDCGVGSLLMIEYSDGDSKKRVVIDRTWIYMCDWKLFDEDVVIIDSDQDFSCTSVSDKLRGLLINESFTGIYFDTRIDLVRMEFTNGRYITLTSDLSSYDGGDDILIIYFNDSDIVSYSPDKKLYSEAKPKTVPGPHTPV